MYTGCFPPYSNIASYNIPSKYSEIITFGITLRDKDTGIFPYTYLPLHFFLYDLSIHVSLLIEKLVFW